jgi:putative ABC transport system permease protein
MSTPLHRPPGAAEHVLRWLLGGGSAAPFVLGDLREEYQALARRHSVARARLWYWFEVVRLPLRMRVERARRAHSISPGGTRVAQRFSGGMMRTEVRQAVRFLRRRPAFSGTIALTIALAIAATTVVFAVVNGVLLRPLPYAEADRLVNVWEHSVTRGNDHNVASTANFIAWGEELRSFDALAALVQASATLELEGQAERIGIVNASGTFFDIIGAEPVIGRFYGPEEDVSGGPAVAVISEGYWQRRFGGDRSIIGQSLEINDIPRTVVGVLPSSHDFAVSASFGGIGTRDVWLPPQFPPQARESTGRFLHVVGRLAPGVTVAQAHAEATALASRFEAEFPDRQTGWSVNVVSLREDIVGDVRATLLIVFGAVCFVLLIACANVANLLMSRATERQQEMAVRAALGAGRARLVRQLLVESAILSTIGGITGLLLANWGVGMLTAAAPDIPRIDGIGVDAAVVVFVLGATLLTTVFFGLAPALHIGFADVGSWLKERGNAGRLGAQRIRGALVVAQVALSLILLIGAGLLVRSLLNRLDLGVGFRTENVVTADLQLPSASYPTPAEQTRFYEQLVERVQPLPGVEAASAIIFAPLTGPGSATSFYPLDRPEPQAGQYPTAEIRWVHRDFHETAGIPLRQGRYLDERDGEGAVTSVLISESGARELWPDESAVGKRVAMPWGDLVIGEIVGVVGDIRHYGPDVPPRAILYWDHRQHRAFSQMTLFIRTTSERADVLPAVRSALRELDPSLPLFNLRTMDELYGNALARARFTTAALGLFALLALILAAIGIYGVMAYVTQQRAQEIGIRMALGADRHSVVSMVVRQGMVLVAFALVVGALGAAALVRLLGSLVFEVSTTDPLTFGAMAVLLGLASLVACWLPARRASGIDPVSAIRNE